MNDFQEFETTYQAYHDQFMKIKEEKEQHRRDIFESHGIIDSELGSLDINPGTVGEMIDILNKIPRDSLVKYDYSAMSINLEDNDEFTLNIY